MGQPFAVPVTLTTQVGASSLANTNVLVVLDGGAGHTVGSDGSLTFAAAGTVTVLPGYQYKMGDGTYSYTIFGKPVVVTVK